MAGACCYVRVFASLTAILGKVGIEGIDSTLGTAIRTVVVLIMAWMIVFVTGKKNTLKHIDRHSMLFLILSEFLQVRPGCVIIGHSRQGRQVLWFRLTN